MSGTITISNQQHVRPVKLPAIRRIAKALLQNELAAKGYELGIFIVDDPEMARLNESFLSHAGPTDVITFDYGEPDAPGEIRGEIFVCVPESERQAKIYRTTWEQELMRYVIHGVLHLCGYDDHEASARKIMKRAENKLVHVLDGRFDFRGISDPGARSTRKQMLRRPHAP